MKRNYSWPKFDATDIKLVSKVIKSNNVNYLFGQNGTKFELSFSRLMNVKHSLAVANGTLALDLCLRSIGIKKGDEVLVTSRSFVASASCISLLGAIPVFCDVDLNSQNISIDEIISKYTKKTKAIICVHFAGFPCAMEEIMDFAKQKKIMVVEDCAQAHGAKINGRSVGSFGDINAWSFCNDKIMTLLGEGGMVTTNSKHHIDFVSSFNNHGKNLKKYFQSKNHTKFPYLHDSIGSNYRLTELQSVIGNRQVGLMPKWHRIRSRNAKIIIDTVKDLELVNYPMLEKGYEHAWYKLYLTLNEKRIRKSSKRIDIINNLRSMGVPTFFGGCGEIYNEKPFKIFKPSQKLKNANYLENFSLMFEVHPTISIAEITKRSKIIRQVLIKFSA